MKMETNVRNFFICFYENRIHFNIPNMKMEANVTLELFLFALAGLPITFQKGSHRLKRFNRGPVDKCFT